MTPDPLEIGKLLILLTALAGIYMKIQVAMRQMAGKGEAREIVNDPLRVQESSRPATLHDVERVESRVGVIEREMKDIRKDADQWRERTNDSLIDLRDRFDDQLTGIKSELREIGRAVGRLEGH
jgi:hypothetical protein